MPPPTHARQSLTPPPATTALGSLLGHITGGHIETIDAGPRSFQPMNINFGLFPPLASPPTKKPDGTRLRGNEKTVAKKQAMSARALADLDRWIADICAFRRRRSTHELAERRCRRSVGAMDRRRPAEARRVFDRRAWPLSRRDGEVDAVLRRLDQVPWWSYTLARHLFSRERRALTLAQDLNVGPKLLWAGRRALVRGFINGVALHLAKPTRRRRLFPLRQAGAAKAASRRHLP